MLQSIRDGLQSQKWLMYIVLGLLALIDHKFSLFGFFLDPLCMALGGSV